MRIQMVTLLAGPDGVLQPGQIADLPAVQAKALIEGGFARPAKEGKALAPIETEMIKPPETAVPPAATGKADPKAGEGKPDAAASSAEPETKAQRKAREKAEREAAKGKGKGG
jgi:hypothetical protein